MNGLIFFCKSLMYCSCSESIVSKSISWSIVNLPGIKNYTMPPNSLTLFCGVPVINNLLLTLKPFKASYNDDSAFSTYVLRQQLKLPFECPELILSFKMYSYVVNKTLNFGFLFWLYNSYSIVSWLLHYPNSKHN